MKKNSGSILTDRLSDRGALRHLWQSPWTGWVGFRYLKSKKNSRFLSFITFISITGVALGVTAMVVVLSVMDGFEAEMKKRLMSSDLHVLITPTSEVDGFKEGYAPKDALAGTRLPDALKSNPEVLDFWPVLTTEAILKTGHKVTGVVVKGVTEERLKRLRTQVVESVGAPMQFPGVFIGQELAYEMNILPGDEVTLVSPTETEGPLEAVPRLKRFTVEGIYHSGLPEQELHTLFSAEAPVRSFLRKADVISQWELTLKDFEASPQVAAQVRALIPQFKVQDWVELNAHLFSALRLERISMFVMLAFIVVVASFNIVTTLTLMVIEKKREIAILKAMGARYGQVAAIFLAEGLFIGCVGIASGCGAGFLVCSFLRRYEFITLPDVFYDRTLPVTFDPAYYGLVAVAALMIVLFACSYPSRRAARLNPLDGIRFG